MLRSKLILLLTLLPGVGTVQTGPLQDLTKLQRDTNAGLLETLQEIGRPRRHPGWGLINLDQFLGLHAWHGRVLHEREGWG